MCRCVCKILFIFSLSFLFHLLFLLLYFLIEINVSLFLFVQFQLKQSVFLSYPSKSFILDNDEETKFTMAIVPNEFQKGFYTRCTNPQNFDFGQLSFFLARKVDAIFDINPSSYLSSVADFERHKSLAYILAVTVLCDWFFNYSCCKSLTTFCHMASFNWTVSKRFFQPIPFLFFNTTR